jgi:hypothetical protein
MDSDEYKRLSLIWMAGTIIFARTHRIHELHSESSSTNAFIMLNPQLTNTVSEM